MTAPIDRMPSAASHPGPQVAAEAADEEYDGTELDAALEE